MDSAKRIYKLVSDLEEKQRCTVIAGTASGTDIVRTVAGEKSYFGFPARTAVINAFFNGDKAFGKNTYPNGQKSVYPNVRLRDRPFANTH